MRKWIVRMIVLAMIFALTACGAEDRPAAQNAAASETEKTESVSAAQETEELQNPETEEFRTMGDVFAYHSDNYASGEDFYIYVFEKDGIIYRAKAEFPPEVVETVAAIDIFDEEYDAKVREAVSPLEIAKLDNLTEMIPPQEELDALVGKTGQDLLDDGWTIWSYQLDIMEFGMYHGPFAFSVVFNGELEMTDNFDEYAAIAPLTIKSVTYDGIGDGTEVG